MQHTHGPGCGCKQYQGVEFADDLYGSIDLGKVRCLNESIPNSGRKVFKEFQNRFDKVDFVASDCDGQVILIVPFQVQVKLKSICVIAKGATKFPNQMRLYVNNEIVDFSITQNNPVQEFEINANLQGEVNHAVRPNKFQSLSKLIMHFKHEGEEIIQISYVQLKGQSTNIKRKPVQAVYQVKPNAIEKDLKDLQKNPFQMG